ncbi:type 1 fimbrial protein [Proteus mirabilis]|nr:fimbrial protein [Proteus mirabilis]MBG6040128.1 type 1 fimbrial protein [Proteus mirabilis]MBS3850791.1 type 1 fimbrial protein [Proteus mirabilis]MBS3854404.1 type 1 fimbrial protein [Proteus mirabilis]MTS86593.1 type 1 fimbrial protein [Proteus mirabilis]
MDFKMKKSLFSLLILSTLSLSTQAIAQEVKIGGTHNINVTGRVVQEALTCNLQAIAPIELADVYVNSIGTAPAKNFSIGFSGCTNQANNRNVKVVIARKDHRYLMNTGQTNADTNARVALLNSQGIEVLLNNDDEFRTFTSNVAGDSGSIQFSLKYMAPDVGTPVTPGAFSSSLSFDAYVTDDVE